MAISYLPLNKLPNPKLKLWTANFILIWLSNLTVTMSFHTLLPTLPIYIQNHGGSKSVAGLALAFLTAAAITLRPFAGWILDNYGRRAILAIGLLTFFVPSLVYISMIGIIPLLIFRVIQGFGWGICNTASGTVASDIIPQSRLGEGLGYFSMTITTSLALAPALGLWLVDKFTFQHLFVTSSLLTLCSLLFALSIKFPKKTNTSSTKAKLILFEKEALRPSIITLLLALCYSSLASFLALFVRQQGLTTAGLFFTVMAVASVISRPFAGKLVDTKGRRGYDIVVPSGLISIVICMLILSQTTSSWYLVVSGLLFGIGFGFLQPTMMALCISSVPPERKGGANSTYWIAFDIGVASGSVGWGILAGSFGYENMFILNIVPALIALLIYVLHRKSDSASASA